MSEYTREWITEKANKNHKSYDPVIEDYIQNKRNCISILGLVLTNPLLTKEERLAIQLGIDELQISVDNQ